MKSTRWRQKKDDEKSSTDDLVEGSNKHSSKAASKDHLPTSIMDKLMGAPKAEDTKATKSHKKLHKKAHSKKSAPTLEEVSEPKHVKAEHSKTTRAKKVQRKNHPEKRFVEHHKSVKKAASVSLHGHALSLLSEHTKRTKKHTKKRTQKPHKAQKVHHKSSAKKHTSKKAQVLAEEAPKHHGASKDLDFGFKKAIHKKTKSSGKFLDRLMGNGAPTASVFSGSGQSNGAKSVLDNLMNGV